MLKVYLLVFIMGICYGGYTYFTEMQNKILQLKENNAKLEIAVATNEQALSSLQADYAAVQAENARTCK